MTCTDPPLTTVRQPIEAMGQAAVALLVNQIAGQAAPSDELLFEPELVVRGSTGPVEPAHSGTGRSRMQPVASASSVTAAQAAARTNADRVWPTHVHSSVGHTRLMRLRCVKLHRRRTPCNRHG